MENFHGFFKGGVLVFRLIMGFWGGKMNKKCNKLPKSVMFWAKMRKK